jgi:MoxR-like ATPase
MEPAGRLAGKAANKQITQSGRGSGMKEEQRPEAESPHAAEIVASARAELGKRIVGQEEMIDGLLAAFVAGGHILLEGAPGLAKTLAARSLAEITALPFRRIQFTPDLLPADITGTLVWEQGTGRFSLRKGPVFASVILADEINRAPAKVQSALLEAMEEGQVTIGEESYVLPDPFIVLATQNPIEHEGTYSLPEAQLDRFLMKLLVRYPSVEEEIAILERSGVSPPAREGPGGSGSGAGGKEPAPRLRAVLGPEARSALREAASRVRLDPRIRSWLVSLVAATRPPQEGRRKTGGENRARDGLYRYISFGASPRASIALARCARIAALFDGRDFVTPEDVKTATLPVLRHRIVLSYEAEAEGLSADTVIARILSSIPVP